MVRERRGEMGITFDQANKWYIKIWRNPIIDIKYGIIKIVHKIKGL